MDNQRKITGAKKQTLFNSIERRPKTLTDIQFAEDIANQDKILYRSVESSRRNKFSNLVSDQKKNSRAQYVAYLKKIGVVPSKKT